MAGQGSAAGLSLLGLGPAPTVPKAPAPGLTDKIADLERQKAEAVGREDYAKATDLKKQIDALSRGGGVGFGPGKGRTKGHLRQRRARRG